MQINILFSEKTTIENIPGKISCFWGIVASIFFI